VSSGERYTSTNFLEVDFQRVRGCTSTSRSNTAKSVDPASEVIDAAAEVTMEHVPGSALDVTGIIKPHFSMKAPKASGLIYINIS
jgi:hypothetical protein